MKIEVRLRGLPPSDSLRDHTVRRVHFHLSRFGRELSGVVRIVDVNGPRGGVDKRCQVTVRGPQIGVSTRDELSDDAFAAVGGRRLGDRADGSVGRTRAREGADVEARRCGVVACAVSGRETPTEFG